MSRTTEELAFLVGIRVAEATRNAGISEAHQMPDGSYELRDQMKQRIWEVKAAYTAEEARLYAALPMPPESAEPADASRFFILGQSILYTARNGERWTVTGNEIREFPWQVDEGKVRMTVRYAPSRGFRAGRPIERPADMLGRIYGWDREVRDQFHSAWRDAHAREKIWPSI